MADNLQFWDSVSKTDPLYTKRAKKGQYHFTSIAPMYQFKMATKAFGMQGIGWGVVVGSEKFNEVTYGTTTILSYDAVLFYIQDGVRGEIPIHSSEKSCYQTQGANGYMKIDDEVRKKVVTNAKTKGLSELGFNADVFMGMFDDPNYVDYRNLEESIDKAEDQEQKASEEVTKFNEWCKKEIATYPSLKNQRTLDLVYVKHADKLKNKCNLLGLNYEAYASRFKKALDEQSEKINKQEK